MADLALAYGTWHCGGDAAVLRLASDAFDFDLSSQFRSNDTDQSRKEEVLDWAVLLLLTYVLLVLHCLDYFKDQLVSDYDL